MINEEKYEFTLRVLVDPDSGEVCQFSVEGKEGKERLPLAFLSRFSYQMDLPLISGPTTQSHKIAFLFDKIVSESKREGVMQFFSIWLHGLLCDVGKEQRYGTFSVSFVDNWLLLKTEDFAFLSEIKHFCLNENLTSLSSHEYVDDTAVVIYCLYIACFQANQEAFADLLQRISQKAEDS